MISEKEYTQFRQNELVLYRFPLQYSLEQFGLKECGTFYDIIAKLGENILEVGFYSGLSLFFLKHQSPSLKIKGITTSNFLLENAEIRKKYLGINDISFQKVDSYMLDGYGNKEFDVIFHKNLLINKTSKEIVNLLNNHLTFSKHIAVILTDPECLFSFEYGKEIPPPIWLSLMEEVLPHFQIMCFKPVQNDIPTNKEIISSPYITLRKNILIILKGKGD